CHPSTDSEQGHSFSDEGSVFQLLTLRCVLTPTATNGGDAQPPVKHPAGPPAVLKPHPAQAWGGGAVRKAALTTAVVVVVEMQ
ncbi:hypothetical protein, partial [Mycobacterium avium]